MSRANANALPLPPSATTVPTRLSAVIFRAKVMAHRARRTIRNLIEGAPRLEQVDPADFSVILAEIPFAVVVRQPVRRTPLSARQGAQPAARRPGARSPAHAATRNIQLLAPAWPAEPPARFRHRPHAATGLPGPGDRRWAVPAVERALSGGARKRVRNRRAPRPLAPRPGLGGGARTRRDRRLELRGPALSRPRSTPDRGAAHAG